MASWKPFLKQLLCVLFFSLIEKKFIFTRNELTDFFFFQFVVAISCVDFMAMIDDKTITLLVLNLDLSGKELILTALLWKQLPWKPPWKQCIRVRMQ
ncbi:unnamed protein product [Brassica rapa]|uniref:Uncharacterized protein n=1 Tax=Brassica campestris TaxID=3711 RepID=A0A8D9D983_BRACM|nr:unnamed protein product [Brassica rapa]